MLESKRTLPLESSSVRSYTAQELPIDTTPLINEEFGANKELVLPPSQQKTVFQTLRSFVADAFEVIPESFRLIRQADPSITTRRVLSTLGQSTQYLVYGGLISSVVSQIKVIGFSSPNIVAPLLAAYAFKCALDIFQGRAQTSETIQQAKIENFIQEKLREIAPRSLERLNQPDISQDYKVVSWGGIWAFTGANSKLIEGAGILCSMGIAVGFAITCAPPLVTIALGVNALYHVVKTAILVQIAMTHEQEVSLKKTEASQFSWKRTWPHTARLYRNLGITEIMDQKAAEKREEVTRAEKQMAKSKNFYNDIGIGLSAITGVGCFYGIMTQMGSSPGALSPETATYLALTMIPIFFSSLDSLGKSMIEITKGKPPLDAMRRLALAREEECYGEGNGSIDWDLHKGAALELSNLHFAYPPKNRGEKAMPIFRDVSLTIEPGSFVSIVGDNGAGKSTLIQLLDRSYLPLAGSISINQQSITEVSDENLFAGFRSLPQYVQQIDGFTIREFLSWGRLGSGREEDPLLLSKITARLGIDEMLEKRVEGAGGELVAEFPDGLDTILGVQEGGKNISGGQLSLLYIAYMLYSEARLLCFDEPEKAIAKPRQKEFFQMLSTIDDLLGYKPTILLVTHKLESAIKADKLIYIEKGSEGVAGFGTHEELMQDNHGYAAWYQSAEEV